MKLAEMKKKTPKELNEQIASLQDQVAELRREKRTAAHTNIHLTRSVRKEIAQLKTVLNENLSDKQEGVK